MRVLIADDDREFAHALAGLVRACNHEVVDTVTGGGWAVIQSYAAHQPDLVLLDIMIPRLNGFTVYHALRSRNPDAKIVFVSGYVQEDHPLVGRCAPDGYLHKPLVFEELRAVLDAVAA